MSEVTREEFEQVKAVAAACSAILKNLSAVADLDAEKMAQSVDAIFGLNEIDPSTRETAREHAREIVQEARALKARKEQ